mmetsp:Transcript_39955/g.80563  ORF Transcript_39955/g.80563 Transcript_39955/m.80563 type:complete len:290 (-) Transcript_39955:212-1081(-)
MRVSVLAVLLVAGTASAFLPAGPTSLALQRGASATLPRSNGRAVARMVAAVPKASAVDGETKAKKIEDTPAPAKAEIPDPLMESEVGADYVPLLTALKCGELEEADQLTRDLLIEIGGPQTQKQGFVYFAQAKTLPLKDMQTIDRLWQTYSDGKFGYSIQKKIWNSPQVKGDFNRFVIQIGWTIGETSETSLGTLKRWLPIGSKGNEFIYDTAKAPKGHLPLTSALRGTYLLKSLLAHPAFGPEPLAGDTTVSAASNMKAGEDLGPLQTMAELRFPQSSYTERKNPWDL